MPNVAVPGPPDGLWKLKFHQVAIYAHEDVIGDAIEFWVNAGYDNWHEDSADLVGSENGRGLSKAAHMFFNYDILPLEMEYVSYEGLHRNSRDDRSGIPPFLSHFSTYVEDIEAEVLRIQDETGLLPYHRFITQGHDNPVVIEKGVRFKEAIYNTRRWLGYDVKMIQRVDVNLPWVSVQAWADGPSEK